MCCNATLSSINGFLRACDSASRVRSSDVGPNPPVTTIKAERCIAERMVSEIACTLSATVL